MSIASVTRPAWGRIPYDLGHREPWLSVPFEKREYEARWRRIGERLAARGLDAVVVTGAPGDGGHVRYLTNFESYVGRTAAIVTAAGECAMATSSLMRAEPMQSSIWMTPVSDVRPTAPRRYMPDAKPLESLIVEILADYCGPRPRVGLAGLLGTEAGAQPAVRYWDAFADFSSDLIDLMAVKSSAEIAVLRRANALADEVFEAVRAHFRPGISESRLAGIAYEAMMSGGAEGPCVPLALVGGPRSGLKHVSPTHYRLLPGDLFFMDLGLAFEGYVTDNARTGLIGPGSTEDRRFLAAAEAMTEAAVAVVRPGVPQRALDDAAFAVAAELGFAEDYYFRAHGVGTTLFQAPRFHPGSDIPLRANEVFSLEPMLVRHGYGTACVERTVLVTDSGGEVLDTSPGSWIHE